MTPSRTPRSLTLFGALVVAAAFAVSGGACSAEAPANVPAGDAGAPDAAGPAVCDPGRKTPPDVSEFTIGGALPNVAFMALDADRRRADFNLHDRYAPCGSEPLFLVLRLGTTTCEPCKIDAKSGQKWRTAAPPGSIQIVDVLLADAEQQVPSVADLAAWRPNSDADVVAATAERRWFALDSAPNHLPYTIVLERRSMHALVLGHGWGWQEYPQRIGALFTRYKRPNPWATFIAPALRDGLFDESEWELIQGMAWSGDPPPADPTNRFADDSAAATFGRTVFFDPGFSASGGVSCASCHDPAKNFGDARPQSVGLAPVDRHAPNVALAAYHRSQFWDGRADSLWMQALGPFENAKEMGFARGDVVGRVAARYRAAYEAVFGALPAVASSAGAAGAMPGTPAWDALPSADQRALTGAFVNVGKAIAAYERTLRVSENRLDRYARGDSTALTEPERKGLKNYIHAGCAQCHAGPRLTDDAYHVLRFPTGRQDSAADRGRIDAFAFLERSEFNGAGAWSDAPQPLVFPADRALLLGAFKTPTIRGIATRGQFGHGGTLATIEDVSAHYGDRGLPESDPRAVGTVPNWVPKFDTTMRDALVPFMKALAGDAVDPAAGNR
jgi:cytochrome c peroxidase